MFIIKLIYVYLYTYSVQSILGEVEEDYEYDDAIAKSCENNVYSEEQHVHDSEKDHETGKCNSTIKTSVSNYQEHKKPEEIDEYTLNDYAYAASIQRKGSHYASGALVDKRWVLSCASEFYNVRESIKLFRVRLGSVDCKRGGTLLPIRVVHIHPGFILGEPSFDLALLKLAVPITSTFTVTPIRLSQVKNNVISAKFMTTYWPRIVVQGKVLPSSAKERVKFTNMRISTQELIPSPKCAKIVKQLKNSSLCMRPVTAYHSRCSPDVGAPVVAKDGLWGITSGWLLPNCPSQQGPTVFTRVSTNIVQVWITTLMSSSDL